MSWVGSDRKARLPSNWSILRAQVLRRDKHFCQLCRMNPATEVDHIQAGDDHRPANLRSVCRTCHKAKSSKEGHQAKAALRAARFRKKPTHPGRRQA